MATDITEARAVGALTENTSQNMLDRLVGDLDGEARFDRLHRMLYSQDASVYQEEPAGVIFPRTRRDVVRTVELANTLGLPIIPRAAGTSLAGQCVGNGLVMDLGRHMNQILELNVEEKWVRVQPGVILDDLNRYLAPHGLFFGPDTSTSNRCMIGGMIGNNSCGTHSILYGTTRDHLLELEVVFSDGHVHRIAPWDGGELDTSLAEEGALGDGLRALDAIVKEHAEAIRERYPRPSVNRRNTGYAFDEILGMRPYTDGEGGKTFELARLLCGSEGTLGIVTEAKLNLVDAPRKKTVVVAHFDSLQRALEATVVAVEFDPAAVELIDRRILELAAENIEQRRNRFFLEGDPEAILAVEFYRDTEEELASACEALVAAFEERTPGYAYPRIDPPKASAVWSLRSAGLGILMGAKGDVKPVTVVEDTAVAVDVLPDYIRDFAEIMEKYGTQCVYYAHASVGELHLRPELNLKDRGDVEKFVGIARDVTDLVKKYGGSISGEHGDGRLRSPMLEQFYGAELTEAHRALKRAFDPNGIFNPGKIVDAAPIDHQWRFEPGEETPEVETYFDWSEDFGLVRSIEKCNGAGVCRKRAEAGGTMCPSYMATLDEKDSTRGRANVFRNLIRENQDPRGAMASEELYEAMDLCISCKGCKSECPANVDMSRMKAEFLQHHHDHHGTPFRSWFFANYPRLSKLGSMAPGLSNLLAGKGPSRWLMGKILGVAPERQLPRFAPQTFSEIYVAWRRRVGWSSEDLPIVGLYIDPFTEYTEPEIGMSVVRVLESAGWRVKVIPVHDDGRTYISKGLLRGARAVLEDAVVKGRRWIDAHPDAKIVGVEPSALLTFRDEAPDLVGAVYREDALRFGERCMLLEEFIVWAHDRGEFGAPWREEPVGEIVLHGHCHQKAIVGVAPTVRALELAGYTVKTLPTGCCGMAGSFGYEEEHYDLSMRIGELVLFPSLRKLPEGRAIAAPGTSCRHQIKDGTGRTAHHPAIWLEWALPGALTRR